MQKIQRNKYKEKIQELITKIQKDIQVIENQIRPISPDNAIGRLSRMEAISEKSVKEATLAKLKLRHKQLEAALLRVDKEDFGLCQSCEEEISDKRLNAMPESLICMSCLEDKN